MFNRLFNHLANFLKPKHKAKSGSVTSQAIAEDSSAADLARSMSSMRASSSNDSSSFIANLQKAVGMSMSQSNALSTDHKKSSVSSQQASSSTSAKAAASSGAATKSAKSDSSKSSAGSSDNTTLSATANSLAKEEGSKSSSAVHVDMGRISPKSVDSANSRAASIESSEAQSSRNSQPSAKSHSVSAPLVPINRKQSKHENHQRKRCYMAIFKDKIQFNSAMSEFLRHRRYLKVGINPQTKQLAFIIGNNKEYDLHLGVRKHKRNGHYHYNYEPYTNRTVIDALVANIKQGYKKMDLDNHGYHLYATDFKKSTPKMIIFSYDPADQNIKEVMNDTKDSDKENDSNEKASKLIQERINQGTER